MRAEGPKPHLLHSLGSLCVQRLWYNPRAVWTGTERFLLSWFGRTRAMESRRLENKLDQGQYILLAAQKGAIGQHRCPACVEVGLHAQHGVSEGCL